MNHLVLSRVHRLFTISTLDTARLNADNEPTVQPHIPPLLADRIWFLYTTVASLAPARLALPFRSVPSGRRVADLTYHLSDYRTLTCRSGQHAATGDATPTSYATIVSALTPRTHRFILQKADHAVILLTGDGRTAHGRTSCTVTVRALP